jgi:hypothetical protein
MTSERFGDGAGADAAGAHLDGANGPFVQSLDLLQIGVPDFTGFVMSMTDIIAGRRFFSAYFTNSGHMKPPECLERVLLSWLMDICNIFCVIIFGQGEACLLSPGLFRGAFAVAGGWRR